MSLFAPKHRLALITFCVIGLDQLTKWIVLKCLPYQHEQVLIPGFFKFVHWGNTGAAWSMFSGNNELLAIIGLVALLVLFLIRRQFGSETQLGQLALGLIFGGIVGNLIDRLHPARRYVIDFIYFFVNPRGGHEIGFPAFNVADSAICIGVGLMFYLSWRNDRALARN